MFVQTHMRPPRRRTRAMGRRPLAGAKLLQRIRVGMILGRLLFKQGYEFLAGWRYCHGSFPDDLGRSHLFSIKLLVGIVVRPQSRTLERYTCEQATSPRVGENFSAQRNIC